MRILNPGKDFENDVRNCLQTVEVARDYLMIDEWIDVPSKESRVLSLLEMVAHDLEDVIANYHLRIDRESKSTTTDLL